MRKIKVCFLIFVLLVFAPFLSITAWAADGKPVVGVAWHNDPGETFIATCKAIEAAGGTPIVLGQVRSADLGYDDNGVLVSSKDADGALTAQAAKLVRCNTWQGSNVESVMEGIAAVVFPGGSDISPSLCYVPQPVWAKEGYSAERDVSDYLLMSYCLEKDVPVLATCRGMQMLSVVSGADLIQDIPTYMSEVGKGYAYEHRNEPKKPGSYRDFAFHDVDVTKKNSILYRIAGAATVRRVPSWHHQMVGSVEGTRLKITGVTVTDGIGVIEAVERPDKTFVLGVQYHPEIAVVRGLDENSIEYFRAIVGMAKQ